MALKVRFIVFMSISLFSILLASNDQLLAQDEDASEPCPISSPHRQIASMEGDTVASDSTLSNAIAAVAQPLDDVADYQPLIDLIGDARLVLIGEASHGTHEFYKIRAELTCLLVTQKQFTAVAIEADWHAAYQLNEYVRGLDDEIQLEAAFDAFKDFPIWMWRNTVVRDFIDWLHTHNSRLAPDQPEVGFYGLDVYGLYDSIDAVAELLETSDRSAAEFARNRYACFEGTEENPQVYGSRAAADDISCRTQAEDQLAAIQGMASGNLSPEQALSLEQNARVVVNAEALFRSMFEGDASTWNMRDEHMAETVAVLFEHLESQSGTAKIVIWAHNSHLGDARGTEMSDRGEINLGQLLRERYGDDVVLIGMSTYIGTVTAANNWGEDPLLMDVNPGLPRSYEELFHHVGLPAFLLLLKDNVVLSDLLREPRLQRAIGVIYRPETELLSHYLEVVLPEQFDAIIHVDETTALEPLDTIRDWHGELNVPD